MVIGKHQPFRRYYFARTASAKVNHRIFQADALRTIHLINADVQSQILHHRRILFLQVGQHPHAFIGMRSQEASGKECYQ